MEDNRAIIIDKILKSKYNIGVLGGDNYYQFRVGPKNSVLTDGKTRLFRKSSLEPLRIFQSQIKDLHVVIGNHDLDIITDSEKNKYDIFLHQLQIFKDRLYAYPHYGISTYTGVDTSRYIINYNIKDINVKMVFLDFNSIKSCKMSCDILTLATNQVKNTLDKNWWIMVFAHEPLIVYKLHKSTTQSQTNESLITLTYKEELDNLSKCVCKLRIAAKKKLLFMAADTHNFQASIVSSAKYGSYPLIVCGTGGAIPDAPLPNRETYSYIDNNTNTVSYTSKILASAFPYGYLDINVSKYFIKATYITCNNNQIVLKLFENGQFKLISDNIPQHDNIPTCIPPEKLLVINDKICSKNKIIRNLAFKKGHNMAPLNIIQNSKTHKINLQTNQKRKTHKHQTKI